MSRIPDKAASLSISLKILFDQISRAEKKPEDLLMSAVEMTGRLVKAAAASIRLYEDKTKDLILAAAYIPHGKNNFNFPALTAE